MHENRNRQMQLRLDSFHNAPWHIHTYKNDSQVIERPRDLSESKRCHICYYALAIHCGLSRRHFCLSKSLCDYIEQVRCALKLMYNAGFVSKPNKCRLSAETTSYIVHVIWPVCLDLANHTTDEVTILGHSTTQTEFRSSLSICSMFS